MNKIRIIDLLNKIANGEEVPKKIKHWKEEYERDESGFIKYESKTERNLCLDLIQCLNDEVETIEEDEDINIQDIEEVPEFLHIGDGKNDKDVKDETNIKINELIKAIKKLDKEMNK